jgi:hypothetical protein
VFKLSQETDKRRTQVEFWIQSILHRVKEGKCVLVGTHASTVPDANVVVDALFNEMNAKYPSFIKAKLAVDSIDGMNIKQLKKEIIFLAQSQVLLHRS